MSGDHCFLLKSRLTGERDGERILANSKEFYNKALKFALDTKGRGHKQSEEIDSSYVRGVFFEMVWHKLFGEPWISPKLDPIKLCGSSDICPQDLPILPTRLKKYGNRAFGIVSKSDFFWAQACKYLNIVAKQKENGLNPIKGNLTMITSTIEDPRCLATNEEYMMSNNHTSHHILHTKIPKGIYIRKTEISKEKKTRNFVSTIASESLKADGIVKVLFYNEDPCGVDFFGLRAEPYLDFSGCGVPVRIYSDRHIRRVSQMDIVLVSQGWKKRKSKHRVYPNLKYHTQIWASCSLENGQTYSRSNVSNIRNIQGINTIISANPKEADIPISFFSYFYLGEPIKSFLREPRPIPLRQKIKKVAILQASCTSKFQYRNIWIEEFIKEIGQENVASMGSCWHNYDAPHQWKDSGSGQRPMAFHMNKMANIKHFTYTLCHESIERDDWVTEKVYQALAMGSVPIYRGSKQIMDLVPCKGCVINANDFKTAGDLARYLASLKIDEYESYLSWKDDIYTPEKYSLFHQKIEEKTIDNSICRLVKKVKPESACTGDCLEEVYKLHRVAFHG
ncbi:hypothetical protein AAMO2058_001592300 [Amorphochlora amoebiformis]